MAPPGAIIRLPAGHGEQTLHPWHRIIYQEDAQIDDHPSGLAQAGAKDFPAHAIGSLKREVAMAATGWGGPACGHHGRDESIVHQSKIAFRSDFRRRQPGCDHDHAGGEDDCSAACHPAMNRHRVGLGMGDVAFPFRILMTADDQAHVLGIEHAQPGAGGIEDGFTQGIQGAAGISRDQVGFGFNEAGHVGEIVWAGGTRQSRRFLRISEGDTTPSLQTESIPGDPMPIPRLPPREFATVLGQGLPLSVVDVRTAKEFAACHVLGAVNLPLDQVSIEAVAALRRGPGPIYLLCQSGVRATAAGERLAAAGMTEVVVVDGGTAGCVQAAIPVLRSGGSVFSLERQLRTIIGLGVCTGALLAWSVHPAWIGLSAFFGAGLVFAGVTDLCPLGLLLARMPWNRSPVVSPGLVGTVAAKGSPACCP